MPLVVVVIAGLAGLLIGSFLNVVIARLPEEDPKLRSLGGRSRCPGCGQQIAAYDNLPVLSWVVLRGRCRHCRERISVQYPLVELLNAVLWAAVAYAAASYAELAAGAVFMSMLVAITFIDIPHRIIPNAITLPGTVVGLALSTLADPRGWWVYIVSALGASAFLLVTAMVYPGGMGLGDVKMALLMGAFLGSAVIIGMFAGFMIGAVLGVALLALEGRAARKMKIPFGPFLAAGSVFAWFWGQQALDWYLARTFS